MPVFKHKVTIYPAQEVPADMKPLTVSTPSSDRSYLDVVDTLVDENYDIEELACQYRQASKAQLGRLLDHFNLK